MYFPGRLTARGCRDFSLSALLLGGPVSASLASCSQGSAWLALGGGCRVWESLPSLSLPTFSRSFFKPSSFSSLLPRGFRWRKKPLLHNAQASLRRGKAGTGTRRGISSGWRGSPAEEIRPTSPYPFEIRSRLPLLATPSLGDCRALAYLRSPSESAAHAGLLESLKLFPSTEATRLQNPTWLAPECKGRNSGLKGWNPVFL